PIAVVGLLRNRYSIDRSIERWPRWPRWPCCKKHIRQDAVCPCARCAARCGAMHVDDWGYVRMFVCLLRGRTAAGCPLMTGDVAMWPCGHVAVWPVARRFARAGDGLPDAWASQPATAVAALA